MKLGCALLVLTLCGCAGSERMLADRDDYHGYRAYRLAPTTIERLRHGNRYLKEHPKGRFHAEVQQWFRRREPEFFRAAYNRPSLLKAYLAALPDGPHAERVIDRLIELEMLRQYRDRQARREEEKLSRVTGELALAQRQREHVTRTFTELATQVAAVRSFGRPIEELPSELLSRLRAEPQPLSCDGDSCVKLMRLPYSVPEAGRIAPREGVLEIRAGLRGGLLQTVTIQGPELFSRLGEAAAVGPVSAADFAARLDAIARVTSLVENVIEHHLPSSSCFKDVVAPVVLRRACQGVELELVAGAAPGEIDAMTIRGLPASTDPIKR